MGKYLVIVLILFSSLSYGQGYSNLGNTNPNDTARILYNWFLPMKGIRMPFYADADSNFLLVRPNSGYTIPYSLPQLVSRINSSIQPIDTTSLSNRINDLKSDLGQLGNEFNDLDAATVKYVDSNTTFATHTYVKNQLDALDTPTWQQTLIESSIMTQSNTVNLNSHEFNFTNGNFTADDITTGVSNSSYFYYTLLPDSYTDNQAVAYRSMVDSLNGKANTNGSNATGEWDIDISGTSDNSNLLNEMGSSTEPFPNTIVARDSNGNIANNFYRMDGVTTPNATMRSIIGKQDVPGDNYLYEFGNLALKKLLDTLVKSNDTALSLTASGHYIFTGTITTWTLPPVLDNTYIEYKIKNRGSGPITLNSNTGGNDLYFFFSPVASLIIEPGESYTIFNDGDYWLIQ